MGVYPMPGVCSPSLFSRCHGNIANTNVNSVLSIRASSYLTEVLTNRSDNCEVTTLFPVNNSIFFDAQAHQSQPAVGLILKVAGFHLLLLWTTMLQLFFMTSRLHGIVCSRKTDVNLKLPG